MHRNRVVSTGISACLNMYTRMYLPPMNDSSLDHPQGGSPWQPDRQNDCFGFSRR